MKKILTLSIALIAVTGAFAQYSNSYPTRGESRDVILGGGNDHSVYNNDRSVYNNNNGNYNDYSYNTREREIEIQRINREFDARIYDVQRNRWMRSNEKNYQIRMLEQQRNQQVQAVRQRFQNSQNSRNRRNDDSYSRNNRRW